MATEKFRRVLWNAWKNSLFRLFCMSKVPWEGLRCKKEMNKEKNGLLKYFCLLMFSKVQFLGFWEPKKSYLTSVLPELSFIGGVSVVCNYFPDSDSLSVVENQFLLDSYWPIHGVLISISILIRQNKI